MGFVQRRLVRGVLWVVAHPKVTLGICALLLLASVVFAWQKLSLSTDENALLTPDLPFFKDYLRFDAKFPENEAFVVVAWPKDDAPKPLATRWIALADEIQAKLTNPKLEVHKDVDRVDTHAPLAELGEQGLMFDDWAGIKEESEQVQGMVQLLKILGQKPGGPLDPETLVLGRNMTERFFNALGRGPAKEGKDFVSLIARSLNNALAAPPETWRRGGDKGALPDLTDLDPTAKYDPSRYGYYFIPDESKRDDPQHQTDKMLIVNIYENRDYSTLADVTEPLKRMRAAVAEVATGYPEFHVSITGRPALEADEMATSDHDTRVAEILGLSLVFIVLWIFLKKLWLVIVAEVSLGVGIGWTFGWATLSTGRLNLLSLVFVIALIGIGMDYLIQVLTRYRHEKQRYTRPEAIWARVFRYVSPPISTACMGAAGAFLVSKLTRFAGAGELGVIAGGGLILCLLAGYTLLPAILTLWPANVGKVAKERRFTDPATTPRVSRWRLVIPLLWGAVALAGLWVALPPHFDPDLIKLQAQNLESVQLVHKLPSWYATVMSDNLEYLKAARAALTPAAGEPTTIRNSESIIDAMEKQAWLSQHNAVLHTIQWATPAPPTATDLRHIAIAARNLLTAWKKQPDAGDLSELQGQIDKLAGTLDVQETPDQKIDRIGRWQAGFFQELQDRANQLAPGPLDLDRLPKEVRDHFVSYLADDALPRSERQPAATMAVTTRPTYAMYVYPRQDLWATDNLGKFVHELEQRAPAHQLGVTVTGIAVQLFHSTEEIRKAFMWSTIYALALIVLLVFLDLRNLFETGLAVSVLAFGLPMLLLMMWIWRALGEPLGIPGSWNFANFFGLPILIGAGHEYGVFMVHRYKESLHDPRRVWGRWDVSDRALLLCAIVTSCSFGFLAFARHRGLASLGWVMAVGTVCIYLATIAVVRPILQWLLQRRSTHRKSP